MSGASALKKINARVKKLAKKYPGKKRTTLQKQAGAEYRAGKLKARKPRKVKAVKQKKRRRRKVASVGAVKKVRRRRSLKSRKRSAAPKIRIRTRTVTKTVRVGSRGSKSLLPIVAVAGLGLLAYMMLKKPSVPMIVQTSNPARNTMAQDAIMYAQAAGIVGNELAKFINTLNASNDTQVKQLYDNVKLNPANPYSNIAGY